MAIFIPGIAKIEAYYRIFWLGACVFEELLK